MTYRLGYTAILVFLVACFATGQTSPSKKGINVVVIDPGHGGRDPGNLGTKRYKTREKDIALAVSLKVGQYIKEQFDSVEVVYTRKTDKSVTLNDRAKIANDADADLFISIHCDSFKKSSVKGTTTIVMGKNHDDENMRVAIKENSVIFLEDNYEENYGGFDPSKPETYIALTMYQNAFLHQSISFAQKVQDQFRERVNRRDRGVKQQPLYVTSRTAMPAVLIELGFLTNPQEEDFLLSAQGQTYMASAIFRAFKEYKAEVEEAFSNAPIPPVENNETPEVVEKNLEPVQSPKDIIGETYYSVQIMTSGLKKDLTAENFKGQENVTFYKDGGLYKYIVGRESSLQEANVLKKKMKEVGFKDAFVIAISNGKRISFETAKQLLQ